MWEVPDSEGVVLDRQEGAHLTPPKYHRMQVPVATAEGEQLVCLVYQVYAPSEEHITPSEAYLATLIGGARSLGLGDAYVAHIASVAAGGATG